jgi:hypothetical protein
VQSQFRVPLVAVETPNCAASTSVRKGSNRHQSASFPNFVSQRGSPKFRSTSRDSRCTFSVQYSEQACQSFRFHSLRDDPTCVARLVIGHGRQHFGAVLPEGRSQARRWTVVHQVDQRDEGVVAKRARPDWRFATQSWDKHNLVTCV